MRSKLVIANTARDYRHAVINGRTAQVDPRTRRVVDVVD
jgi:hypothetical protein